MSHPLCVKRDIMKRYLLMLAVVVLPMFSWAQGSAKVPFGDPFIMLYDGTYYAYGTNSGSGIRVYVSDDLKTWRNPEGRPRLALKKEDSGAARDFWAPEVYRVNGRFYMYFSGESHVRVATSDSPLGPFVEAPKKPMFMGENTIDNSLFVDDDGRAYMYFDRFNDGLNVWVCELEADLKTIKPETLTKCINVSQPWEEVWPRVNEGPFVMKHKRRYYMTYSANSYESQSYGIGMAVADTPYGPWKKYGKNPIYQNVGELVGIGHSAMFRDKRGRLRIVFHAHNSKSAIHPRGMYISRVRFKYDKEAGYRVMVVDPRYMTPVLAE